MDWKEGCCCFTLKLTNTRKENLKVIRDHLAHPCSDIFCISPHFTTNMSTSKHPQPLFMTGRATVDEWCCDVPPRHLWGGGLWPVIDMIGVKHTCLNNYMETFWCAVWRFVSMNSSYMRRNKLSGINMHWVDLFLTGSQKVLCNLYTDKRLKRCKSNHSRLM